MKIDLKSYLIGALSVVCVVLLTGAKDSNKSEVGRYQISASALAEHIIDTKTGEVIQRIRNSKLDLELRK